MERRDEELDGEGREREKGRSQELKVTTMSQKQYLCIFFIGRLILFFSPNRMGI